MVFREERLSMVRTRRLLASVAVVLVLVAGAGLQVARPAAVSAAASTFVVASDNVGVSLDPAVAADQPSLQIATAAYETLVDYNAKTKRLEPALASKSKITNHGKSITLTLRRGVKFHDGSPLTSGGIVASLNRTVAIGKGESFLISDMSKVKALSGNRVLLTLKSPSSDFLYALTRIFIVSGQAVKKHAGTDEGQSWFASHEDGSGPYKVTSWQPNNHFTLIQFKGYWRGWKGHHVTRYQFNEVSSPETQQLDVENGTVDFANAVPTNAAYKLRKSKKVQVKFFPGSPFYLMFNTSRAPLNNVRVREALSLAVPYKQVISQIMYDMARPLKGPVPSWMAGANKTLSAPKEDMAKAKALLTSAGYSPSHPLTLRYAYFPGWAFEQTIATDYQYLLSKIGVTLTIDSLPWATFTQQISQPSTRPDIGSIAVYVPIPSPGPTLTYSFDPGSAGNWAYWGYKNNQVTKLLHQASATLNAKNRVRLYARAEKALVNSYPAAWLMEMPDVFVLAPNVHGLQHDASWGQILNVYGIYKG